jgi:hypothetical protein
MQLGSWSSAAHNSRASTMVADCYGKLVRVDRWPDEASQGFAFSLPFAALGVFDVRGESSPRSTFALRDGVGTTSTQSARRARMSTTTAPSRNRDVPTSAHDSTIRVDSLRYPICKAFCTQRSCHLNSTAALADEQDFQMIELPVPLN